MDAESSIAAAAPRSNVAALDVLSKGMAGALRGSDFMAGLDARKPVAVAFVDAVISSPDAPEDLVVAALRGAGSSDDALSDTCLANPREFWKVVSVYQPLISKLPFEAPAFQLAVENFSALGDAMVTKVCLCVCVCVCVLSVGRARCSCTLRVGLVGFLTDRMCCVAANQDAATATALFNDFAMRSLCAVITANARKRAGILSIMYSFASRTWEDHANVIRLLQDTLDDLPTFISCLTHLIYLETEFDVRATHAVVVVATLWFVFMFAYVCVATAGPAGRVPVLLPHRHGTYLSLTARRIFGDAGCACREQCSGSCAGRHTLGSVAYGLMVGGTSPGRCCVLHSHDEPGTRGRDRGRCLSHCFLAACSWPASRSCSSGAGSCRQGVCVCVYAWQPPIPGFYNPRSMNTTRLLVAALYVCTRCLIVLLCGCVCSPPPPPSPTHRTCPLSPVWQPALSMPCCVFQPARGRRC